MSESIIKKFLSNPFRFIQNSFYKFFISPRKYKQNNDYNVSQYWKDRFTKHGSSLIAVGNEGLSEKENEKSRQRGLIIFKEVFNSYPINASSTKILEIGCGTGYYTDFVNQSGLLSYKGLDITDHFFPELRLRYPKYSFVKQDVSTEVINDKFDLIIMMDVIQHIVLPEKLKFTLENIQQSLNKNGLFILAPVTEKSQKHMFHVHEWSLLDIQQYLSDKMSIQKIHFRHKESLIKISS